MLRWIVIHLLVINAVQASDEFLDENIHFDLKFNYNQEGQKEGYLVYKKQRLGMESEWIYAGADSWNAWSDEQKCDLLDFLKKHQSVYDEVDCDYFKAKFPLRIPDNDYITVDSMLIPRMMGFLLKMNSQSMEGRDLAGDECKQAELQKTILLGDEIVPPYPASRYTFALAGDVNYCLPPADLEEFKQKFKEGYEGKIKSAQTYFLNFLSISNKIIMYANPFALFDAHALLGGGEYRRGRDANTGLSDTGESTNEAQEVLEEFKKQNKRDLGKVLRQLNDGHNIVGNDKGRRQFAKDRVVPIIETCDVSKGLNTQKAKLSLTALLADNKITKKEFDRALREVESEERAHEQKFEDLKDKIDRFVDTGDYDEVEEEVKEAQPDIVKENAREQSERLNEEGDKIGVDLIDPNTGEKVGHKEFRKDDFYDTKEKIDYGVHGDRFKESAVDFSKKKGEERVKTMAARFKLEAERRGVDLSSEDAYEMAKGYEGLGNAVVNFDKIFGVTAQEQLSGKEVDYFKQKEALYKEEARREMLNDYLNRDDLDDTTRERLIGELEETNKRLKEKKERIKVTEEKDSSLKNSFRRRFSSDSGNSGNDGSGSYDNRNDGGAGGGSPGPRINGGGGGKSAFTPRRGRGGNSGGGGSFSPPPGGGGRINKTPPRDNKFEHQDRKISKVKNKKKEKGTVDSKQKDSNPSNNVAAADADINGNSVTGKEEKIAGVEGSRSPASIGSASEEKSGENEEKEQTPYEKMLLRKIDELKKKYNEGEIQRMLDIYVVQDSPTLIVKDRILIKDRNIIQGLLSLKLYLNKGDNKFYFQNYKKQISPEFKYDEKQKGYYVEKHNYVSEEIDRSGNLVWIQDFK